MSTTIVSGQASFVNLQTLDADPKSAYTTLMPIYEYQCLEDGETIELLRPMREADAPVDDPKGKGRRFVRTQSTFSVAGSPTTLTHQHSGGGGGCACGNPHGPCNQ